MTPHRSSPPDAGRSTGAAVRHRVSLVMLASVGAALLLAGCASGRASAPATTAASTSVTTGGGTSGTAEIAISNFMFIPASLTVAPGTVVTVVNRDNVAHTVTSSSGGFNTADIAPGASVVFTAPDHAGHFAYICSIHQYMTGTLVVS